MGSANRIRAIVARLDDEPLLEVRESTRSDRSSGLGVFALRDIPEGTIATEFAGPKERKSLADYEKRLMAVQVHGEGWEAGLNKIYTTADEDEDERGQGGRLGRLRSFTVFGRNFPEEPTTTAEEREGFLRGGVAQLINDHTALKMSGACVEIDQ